MAKKKLVKGLWSKSEVTLLRKLFPSNPTAKVAARLWRSTEILLFDFELFKGGQSHKNSWQLSQAASSMFNYINIFISF